MDPSKIVFESYDAVGLLEPDRSSSSSQSSFDVVNLSRCYPAMAPYTPEESLTRPPMMSASFPATGTRPSMDDFPGPYDFEIQLSSVHAGSQWVYSQLLNSVFTDLGKSFHVDVVLRTEWTSSPALFIRALPVFLTEGSLEEPVKRCATHEDSSNAMNVGFSAVKHVVRCSDPQTQYQTDPESGRHSVVTPLSAPQPGTSSVPFLYSFACKNSCGGGGIGRRRLGLVFTLETSSGQIMGRHVLGIRVCSCPKRDKDKLEQQYLRSTSRDQSDDVPSRTKKLRCVPKNEPLVELVETTIIKHQLEDVVQEAEEQQAEKILEIPLLSDCVPEWMKQALAIIWRDSGEQQTAMTPYDISLLQIYREG